MADEDATLPRGLETLLRPVRNRTLVYDATMMQAPDVTDWWLRETHVDIVLLTSGDRFLDQYDAIFFVEMVIEMFRVACAYLDQRLADGPERSWTHRASDELVRELQLATRFDRVQRTELVQGYEYEQTFVYNCVAAVAHLLDRAHGGEPLAGLFIERYYTSAPDTALGLDASAASAPQRVVYPAHRETLRYMTRVNIPQGNGPVLGDALAVLDLSCEDGRDMAVSLHLQPAAGKHLTEWEQSALSDVRAEVCTDGRVVQSQAALRRGAVTARAEPSGYAFSDTYFQYIIPIALNTADMHKTNATGMCRSYDARSPSAMRLTQYRDAYLMIADTCVIAAFGFAMAFRQLLPLVVDDSRSDNNRAAGRAYTRAAVTRFHGAVEKAAGSLREFGVQAGWSAHRPLNMWERDLLIGWGVQSTMDGRILDAMAGVGATVSVHTFTKAIVTEAPYGAWPPPAHLGAPGAEPHAMTWYAQAQRIGLFAGAPRGFSHSVERFLVAWSRTGGGMSDAMWPVDDSQSEAVHTLIDAHWVVRESGRATELAGRLEDWRVDSGMSPSLAADLLTSSADSVLLALVRLRTLRTIPSDTLDALQEFVGTRRWVPFGGRYADERPRTWVDHARILYYNLEGIVRPAIVLEAFALRRRRVATAMRVAAMHRLNRREMTLRSMRMRTDNRVMRAAYLPELTTTYQAASIDQSFARLAFDRAQSTAYDSAVQRRASPHKLSLDASVRELILRISPEEAVQRLAPNADREFYIESVEIDGKPMGITASSAYPIRWVNLAKLSEGAPIVRVETVRCMCSPGIDCHDSGLERSKWCSAVPVADTGTRFVASGTTLSNRSLRLTVRTSVREHWIVNGESLLLRDQCVRELLRTVIVVVDDGVHVKVTMVE